MKKFLLFIWYEYQAEGGMNDFYGSYDSIGEAREAFEYHASDGGNYFCQVVNRESMSVVYSEYIPPVERQPPTIVPVIQRWEYAPTDISDWI